MRVDGTSPNFYDMTRGLREAFQTVQKQIATGQKANQYGELGTRTQSWLDYARAATQAEAYTSAIAQQNVRVKLIDSTLGGLVKTVQSASSVLNGGLETLKSGSTIARNAFAMVTDLLNTQNGTVPLFGGGARTGAATLSADAMMNGDGTQPGLRTLINERIQAETGGNDLGRLTITGSGSGVTLTRSGGVFGYKVLGVTSSNPGVSAHIAAGPPQTTSITSSAALQAGDTIIVKLGLPDGSEQSVTLSVGDGGLAPGSFDGSAFATALSGKLASVTPALKTAAALQVAKDYFAGTMSRVSGSPATSATTLAAASPVNWYLGTKATDPRTSFRAQVSDQQMIAAGVQANEAVFTNPLAALAATTVLLEDPAMQTAEGRTALQSSLLPKLAPDGLTTMQVEFGIIQKQYDDAKGVQAGIKTIADTYLANENHVDNTELSAQLLTLQNHLQASYQAGARILKLTLTDYI